MKYFVLFFLLYSPLVICSQNLVKNNSFEDVVICPTYFNHSPNSITPEWNTGGNIGSSIYNSCFTITGPGPYYNNFDVPNNTVGYQYAHHDSGYAGLYTYADTIFAIGGSTYLYQVLQDTLKPNTKYHIGYHISLADNSKYTTSAMGMHLSGNYNSFISSFNNIPPGFHKPFNVVNTTQVLTDKAKWYKLEWDYTAIGNECIILIGNKRTGIAIDTVDVGTNFTLYPDFCYYFIDDVFVIPIKEYSQKICTANDSMQLQAIEAGTKYKWSNGDTTSSITVTQNGIYTLLTTHDSLYRRDTFNVMLNHPTNLVYNYLPNEVYIIQGASLGLQGPAGANYTYLWSNGDTTQNTLVNANGTYTLQVTAQDGCMAFDTCEVKYITASPTNLPRGEAFTIVPNPNNGSFSISTTDNLNNQTILTITNTLGQVIDKINLVSTTTNYENTQLENGIYFYTVTEKNTILAKGKMIVQSK